MIELGFTQVLVKHCIYVQQRENGNFVIAAIHIDNFEAIGLLVSALDDFEANLKTKYEILVGNGKFLLRVHFQRN
jgi:hypothetical protein